MPFVVYDCHGLPVTLTLLDENLAERTQYCNGAVTWDSTNQKIDFKATHITQVGLYLLYLKMDAFGFEPSNTPFYVTITIANFLPPQFTRPLVVEKVNDNQETTIQLPEVMDPEGYPELVSYELIDAPQYMKVSETGEIKVNAPNLRGPTFFLPAKPEHIDFQVKITDMKDINLPIQKSSTHPMTIIIQDTN